MLEVELGRVHSSPAVLGHPLLAECAGEKSAVTTVERLSSSLRTPLARTFERTSASAPKRTESGLARESEESWSRLQEPYQTSGPLHHLVTDVIYEVGVHSRGLARTLCIVPGLVVLMLCVAFCFSQTLRESVVTSHFAVVIALLAVFAAVAAVLYVAVLLDVRRLAREFLRSLSPQERLRLAIELREIGRRLGVDPSTLARTSAAEAFVLMCKFASQELQCKWGVVPVEAIAGATASDVSSAAERNVHDASRKSGS